VRHEVSLTDKSGGRLDGSNRNVICRVVTAGKNHLGNGVDMRLQVFRDSLSKLQ
jgi:hypothetical protein